MKSQANYEDSTWDVPRENIEDFLILFLNLSTLWINGDHFN